MGTKPAKHSRVELLTSSIHGTAMTSIRHLPQDYVSRNVGTNAFGLLGRDVVIRQSVYQKNRHMVSDHRPLGRGIRQVDAASQMPLEECRFHYRAMNDSAQPRSCAKELTHPHECNLAEAGERRFGDHGAKRRRPDGLENYRRPHRLAHPENALREALKRLYDLLEQYAPAWYTSDHHDHAESALGSWK